jgi:hypothetical protein
MPVVRAAYSIYLINNLVLDKKIKENLTLHVSEAFRELDLLPVPTVP